MPLINGLKMACEPCIRGHRSTKCTHANERLMVPVRKPGRPLSQCPHPKDQPCGCGSVTAAIPRKQACHCGTDTPVSTPPSHPQRSNSTPDATSPIQLTFKVQKSSSRPPSSRKQSFDPANLERMDFNQINILPFNPHQHQHTQSMPILQPNPYQMTSPPPPYGFAAPPQYQVMQQQYGNIPLQLPPPMHSFGGSLHDIKTNGINGYKNGHNGLDQVVESPLETPTEFKNGQITPKMNGGSCCTPEESESPPTFSDSPSNGDCCAPKQTKQSPFTKGVSNGGSCCASKATPQPKFTNGASNSGSCCAPKQNGHSHTRSNASSISEPQQSLPQSGGCCSSKTSKSRTAPPLMSTQLPPNGFQMNPYTQYPSGVFTYPATYGSYQNPLQPSAWRQINYSQHQHEGQPPILTAPIPFVSNPTPENPETVHTCGCGDGCQCIGCAAHPYNDATQEYVRSAWASMQLDQGSEVYSPHTNGHIHTNSNHQQTNGSGNSTPHQLQTQDLPKENPTSPPPATPSSTTSGTGEEQSLSASDFFFVNYPFQNGENGEGCAGEMQSCPCGDDCQCLGCTIHNLPQVDMGMNLEMECPGEKDTCPCGDDCACIGCTIHNM